MLFVSYPIGEATGTRRSCSQPRAEARSRGAAGAERSELALDGDAGSVASRRDRGACDHAAATVTRKREHPGIRAIVDEVEGVKARLVDGKDLRGRPRKAHLAGTG